MKRTNVGVLLVLVTLSSLAILYGQTQRAEPKPDRDKARQLQRDGNYKEAYDQFSRLALDPKDEPDQVGGDLTQAVANLNQLGRQAEIDGLLEKVIALHKDNWRLLVVAAQLYMNDPHYGYIIAGEFQRGQHRGGGRYVNAFERDRVRALQLMQQAMAKVPAEGNRAEAGNFYWQLAQMLLSNRGFGEAWRLQYLTDLSVLPDHEEGYYYGYSGSRGAPVDEQGNPVLHRLPKSWQAAATDGQRWRWALVQTMEADAARTLEVRLHFAQFLHNQFGVQTMADRYGYFRGGWSEDDAKKDESGTYALHTLEETETIARLATGVKRFKLEDEFNFIRILQEVAAEKKSSWGEQALGLLAQIFENRRQYPKAAPYWQRSIDGYGDPNGAKKHRLEQIVANWGMFEPVLTQPAGQGATVEYRFRNGAKVRFEAYEIDAAKLLADVKDYLKGAPARPEWWQVDVGNFGYRLVEKNQTQYLKGKVAEWSLDLQPRPNHWDRRITVATPLQKPGAYWLVAKMADGNTSRIVIWLADTAIVTKPLSERAYYFVCDAVTGQPVPKATLEFFGYWQEWINEQPRGSGRYVVHTANFAEFTDADGQCMPKPDQMDRRHSWLVTATTPQGRFAYHGFQGVWYSRLYDAEYNQAKVFVMTDRPVYRPEQTVKFKFWVNHARYDQEGKSAFAGQKFTVRVNNPRNEKVFEKEFTADEYGGFDGELKLEDEAALGVYQVFLPRDDKVKNPVGGGGNFRVEEYKKPEFEVKIEAPEEPVMLGEKITARIQAKYYFGAPVTEAKVRYKVLRSEHDSRWYPIAPWDWFYGRGYWWFAYDYDWYPGWSDWGCRRPLPWWWWRWQRPQPPEVVAEAEAPIGADGIVKVEIDTALAKEMQGDRDHKYEITAEVTDRSRRTIVGTGTVLVARKPFKVYAWVDRGHFRVGDAVGTHFCAQTLDNKPVKKAKGEFRLLKITYKDAKPVEEEVLKQALDTNEEGRADLQVKAAQPGQFRLSYKVTDAKGHAIEGGYVFCVIGQGFDGGDFRFNDIELTADQKDYKPDDRVRLMINTDRANSTVLLFVRPTNGVYLPPKVLRLKGKSVVEEIEVLKKDMPNFFLEGLTVSGGKVYTQPLEVVVPPESRILKAEVQPSAEKYKPGEKAKVKVKLTDPTGEPYSGSVVLTVYDKAVEYVSGGSNVPDIKEFFWKWRRHHNPQTNSSLSRGGTNVGAPKETGMSFLGVFGRSVVEEITEGEQGLGFGGGRGGPGEAREAFQRQSGGYAADGMPGQPGAPMAARALMAGNAEMADRADKGEGGGGAPEATVEPTVRTQFADTALWVASLTTDKDGLAEVNLTMPENLTTWKFRLWAMGSGARCGEASGESVTTKNLLLRLQAPRFFVQKDEVVLSANVHNYLDKKKSVRVVLEMEGKTLEPMARDQTQTIEVDPNGEKRVDWRVKVTEPGQAVVRMKALTDEESDAMAMTFPVFVHGMLKTESFSGVIRPDKDSAEIAIRVPAERRPEQSRLEVRYSPTLAGAMVDALPYMTDYPYGCTEQTLNRFLPTVITQKVLLDMKLDLKDIQKKRTNLNAQEIGDDAERAKDWAYRGGYMSRATAKVKDAVFDEEEVRNMVKAGLNRLTSMQCSDGGWGWFSGWGERSWPHTTAIVVHGLQIARANDVAIVPGVLERGVKWLQTYQAEQVRRLKLPPDHREHKPKADNLDALVYMVLVDEKLDHKEMREFLYRDRNDLSVYAKAMLALACHRVGDAEKRDMLRRNVEQFLKQDEENQTAYLELPAGHWWWCWFDDEIEADAYYLKLLAAVDPKNQTASRLVKYLLNNRKHATYWKSTRDTALVIEAFADYLRASGEDKPDMTVEILLDGKSLKQVKIDADNLFSFDNKLILAGNEVTTGQHRVEFRKKGAGAVYFNAYLTNFTLEDPITRAGLEIKVERKYYKLVPVDKTVKVEGSRGQALDRKVEKYERKPLANLDTLVSGDLVEIELEIESKNDYEYIIFEDMKAAGFEPVEVRSGYNRNDLGAYMELRDERVCFFVRALARGRHSVAYRMRAEIPGRFSALPTRASAMYAPELKANSDEIKLQVRD